MMNDYLPAIVALSILAAAFLFAWLSDVRGARSAEIADETPEGIAALLATESNKTSLG